MSCSTTTAPVVRSARTGVDADRHDHAVLQRQLDALALAAGERGAHLRGDVRIAHDLEVVTSFSLFLQPQHPRAAALASCTVPRC